MSSSRPCPFSDAWKACAVPWKLVFSVAGTRSSRWTCSTCFTASLSDTPGFVLNEIVTAEGKWTPEQVLAAHRPETLAIERLFFNANVRTAMTVGQASGVVLLLAAEHGLEVTAYTPPQVKQAVTGSGSAPKEQVGYMVKALLGLASVPTPADTADALAVALCHLNHAGLAGLGAGPDLDRLDRLAGAAAATGGRSPQRPRPVLSCSSSMRFEASALVRFSSENSSPASSLKV